MPGKIVSTLNENLFVRLVFREPFVQLCRCLLAKLLCVSGGENGAGGRKKKRSRWGDSEVDKAFIPGMPTVLPANMSKDQEELYLRKYLFFGCLTLFW